MQTFGEREEEEKTEHRVRRLIGRGQVGDRREGRHLRGDEVVGISIVDSLGPGKR